MKNDQTTVIPDIRYKAFISYRHLPLDKEAAEKIQKGIENYFIPKEFRSLAGATKLGKVFRDEDELPISSSLSDSITYALDHTEYLIVVCTPDLPKSRWCTQEIKYFLETHDRDHIIAVLADGTPDESFSPYLLHEFDEAGNITNDLEPLAANIAGANHTIDKKSFKKEMTRIRAALLGVPFDSLWQREKRRRIVQMAVGMGIVIAGLAVFLGVTLSKNAQIREQNEQISSQNEQIKGQNEEISRQNEEISDKNLSLQKQLSSMLVDTGNGLLKEFDRRGAIKNALEAVESGDPEIYDHRAERLLMNALGAYTTDALLGELIYEQTTDIVDLAASRTDSKAYLADIVGNVSCVDTESGKLLWRETSVYSEIFNGEAKTRLYLTEDQGLLLCKNFYNLAALSLEDGSMVWNYTYENGNTMFALSGDGSRIAIFDRMTYVPGFDPSSGPASSTDRNNLSDLIFLNTEDGTETGRFTLGDDQSYKIAFSVSSRQYGACFSDSGHTFACAFARENVDDYNLGNYEYYLINADTAEQIKHGSAGYSLAAEDIFYGIAIDEDTESMFVTQYNARYGGILELYFHGDTLTVDENLIEQTLKGDGSFMTDYNKVITQPMCCSDDLAILASENSLFVLDRDTGALKKSFALDGDILDMVWEDRDEEILRIITSSGKWAYYDLSHDEGGWFDYYSSDSLSQNNNAAACVVLKKVSGKNSLAFDGYLTVPKDQPGRLIRVRSVSDPNFRQMELPENYATYKTFFCSSPSGERLFRLSGGKAEWTLSAFDAATGELIAENSFPDSQGFYNTTGIVAIDEKRVIGRIMIMPLDGEAQPINALKDYVDKIPYSADSVQSCRLYNGQVMTVVDLSLSSIFSSPFDYIALDGATVLAINEPENRVMFAYRSVFEIGANGFELGHGYWCWFDENDRRQTSEEPAYVLFDALGEKRYVIEDAAPEATSRKVSLGTREPLFVCGDDTGRVWLYDIPSGQARLVSDAYSKNEIMDVTMIPGDKQAAVFSRTGKLDILDLETGEVLYTDSFSSLLTYISDYNCYCEKDETNERLYLLITSGSEKTGRLSRVDMHTWTTDFSFSGNKYYGWSRADDRIYAYYTGIYSFPAYKLEDYVEWAKKTTAADAE